VYKNGMDKTIPVTTLFLDIGGVMLSNGWGHESRRLAADVFNLDFSDMDERHHLTQVTYEEGKLTLGEYLKRVVFYRKRSFTPAQFREFMFAQTTPDREMIEFIQKLKVQYRLKIVVVNNEGRELNEYRIKKFQLNQFVDFFISSCFVHFRKPDADIFRIALDIAQVTAEHVVYIEDIQMFVDIASESGIRSIRHKSYLSTSGELAAMGLKIE
jgi:putative hydrolase of the HAD superfamily